MSMPLPGNGATPTTSTLGKVIEEPSGPEAGGTALELLGAGAAGAVEELFGAEAVGAVEELFGAWAAGAVEELFGAEVWANAPQPGDKATPAASTAIPLMPSTIPPSSFFAVASLLRAAPRHYDDGMS